MTCAGHKHLNSTGMEVVSVTDTAMERYTARQESIRERLRAIHEEVMELMGQEFTAPYNSEERSVVRHRIEELDRERDALHVEQDEIWKTRDEELEYQLRGYTRPSGWLASSVNKGLGPLPSRSLVVEPSAEALGTVKSYRALALLTTTIAVIALVGLTYWLPWMSVSPYTALYHLALWSTGSRVVAGIAAVLLSLMAVKWLSGSIRMGRSASSGTFWDNAAMWEEHWFRTGAEAWNWRQRTYSCLAFGFIHIMNIIYPIASILVVGVVMGGMAMTVYLAEYRRSEDPERATLASAKFHATYNRFAITYMVVALGVVALSSFLS